MFVRGINGVDMIMAVLSLGHNRFGGRIACAATSTDGQYQEYHDIGSMLIIHHDY